MVKYEWKKQKQKQKKSKKPMGYNSLIWLNSYCIICKCHATVSSIATETRTQIWRICKKFKGHSSIIIWSNLVDFESPMLYTKVQPQSFLISWEDCLSVLPYMGNTAILFNGVEPFEQIVNILLTEGPMWNLVKIVQTVSEVIFRCHDFIHVHSPGVREDNPQKLWW